jgi:hypothetical protein
MRSGFARAALRCRQRRVRSTLQKVRPAPISPALVSADHFEQLSAWLRDLVTSGDPLGAGALIARLCYAPSPGDAKSSSPASASLVLRKAVRLTELVRSV